MTYALTASIPMSAVTIERQQLSRTIERLSRNPIGLFNLAKNYADSIASLNITAGAYYSDLNTAIKRYDAYSKRASLSLSNISIKGGVPDKAVANLLYNQVVEVSNSIVKQRPEIDQQLLILSTSYVQANSILNLCARYTNSPDFLAKFSTDLPKLLDLKVAAVNALSATKRVADSLSIKISSGLRILNKIFSIECQKSPSDCQVGKTQDTSVIAEIAAKDLEKQEQSQRAVVLRNKAANSPIYKILGYCIESMREKNWIPQLSLSIKDLPQQPPVGSSDYLKYVAARVSLALNSGLLSTIEAVKSLEDHDKAALVALSDGHYTISRLEKDILDAANPDAIVKAPPGLINSAAEKSTLDRVLVYDPLNVKQAQLPDSELEIKSYQDRIAQINDYQTHIQAELSVAKDQETIAELSAERQRLLQEEAEAKAKIQEQELAHAKELQYQKDLEAAKALADKAVQDALTAQQEAEKAKAEMELKLKQAQLDAEEALKQAKEKADKEAAEKIALAQQEAAAKQAKIDELAASQAEKDKLAAEAQAKLNADIAAANNDAQAKLNNALDMQKKDLEAQSLAAKAEADAKIAKLQKQIDEANSSQAPQVDTTKEDKKILGMPPMVAAGVGAALLLIAISSRK